LWRTAELGQFGSATNHESFVHRPTSDQPSVARDLRLRIIDANQVTVLESSFNQKN